MARPAPLHSLAVYANAGTVLQKAIQQLSPAERSSIILRCGELAHLQISEEALEKAFAQLLQLIVADRGDAKLFLHITCSKEKDQETRSCFLVQFHTNLTPHAAWMQEAERRTNSIALLLQPFGGRLVVNQLKNSGCVFAIALPGK